jgi:EmrB/QacA subfamily drug resistance transporter
VNSKTLATIGLVIGIFLEALEGTVVATAMPAVVNDLGGQHLYALPFSIYLLTQTVSAPLWGRVSDLTSRKKLYLAGVVLYLLGSGLSGAAHNMPWLIAMRVIQGLGAGCLLTLTFTLIGEMYELQQRAKVQGYISAVWGIAGLLGPLAGGLIVDNVSWRWVFYLNLPFGLIALVLCVLFLQTASGERGEFRLDIPGAALLVTGAGLLVWGLDQKVLWMVLCGVVAIAAALPFELRHPAPLLPIKSLQNIITRNSLLNNLLAGAAYFGAVAYIPLFVQQVAGADATMAGVVLTPMVVGWTVASILGGRILSRVGLETINTAGFFLLAAGFMGFVAFIHRGIYALAATGFIAGFGMGFGMLTTLLLVQDNSPKEELGAATAAAMYARTIGGALGVSLISLVIVQTIRTSNGQLITEFQRGFFLSFILAFAALVVSAWKIRPAKGEPSVGTGA